MPWTEDEFRRALDDAAEGVVVRATAADVAARMYRRRRRGFVLSAAAATAMVAAVALLVVALPSAEKPANTPAALGQLGDLAATATPFVRGAAGGGPIQGAPVQQPRTAENNQGTKGSIGSSVSADGRFVAFSSDERGLVAGDRNNASDVFVRDLETGRTILASVSDAGKQGNAGSRSPDLSADGRYVAFTSDASNLVAVDGNRTADVFVRDLVDGKTVRVSVRTDGAGGGGSSHTPSIADDGMRVAFRSIASNLVDGDSNRVPDIFVRDLRAATTTIVSIASDGTRANGSSERPAISGDGRFVAFASDASNLVSSDANKALDVFVRDLDEGATVRESLLGEAEEIAGPSTLPSLSRDGSVLAFIAQVPGAGTCKKSQPCLNAYVRNRASRQTRLISAPPDGTAPNGDTLSAVVAAEGRFVAFSTDASNLVADDTNGVRDIFVYDGETSEIDLVSVASDGEATNGASGSPSISADGSVIAWQSLASNIVSEDKNERVDIFVRTGETEQNIIPVSLPRVR